MKLHILEEKRKNIKRIWRITSLKMWSCVAPNYIELDDGTRVQYAKLGYIATSAGNTKINFTASKARRFLSLGITPMHTQAAVRFSKGAITPDDIFADELFNMMLAEPQKIFRREEKEFVFKQYRKAGLEKSLEAIKSIKTR